MFTYVQTYRMLWIVINNNVRNHNLRRQHITHLWPDLLQGGEGSDIWVRHGACDRDPEEETSLDVTGEIKPWKTDSSISLWVCQHHQEANSGHTQPEATHLNKVYFGAFRKTCSSFVVLFKSFWSSDIPLLNFSFCIFTICWRRTV